MELIDSAMATKRALHHVVINVAKVVGMLSNADLRSDVCGADLINVDGMGVVWGARLFGVPVPERVSGVDVMERLFGLCAERGYRPFLLGAEQSVLEAVQRRLHVDYPSLVVAGMRDGYFKADEESALISEINASGADCLLVAMPTPKKERFLGAYRAQLSCSFVMGVGGSFDVYGGKVARAPLTLQQNGMEWAYRVWQEPRRLWRRYLTTNARFCWLMFRETVLRRFMRAAN
ncbi:WecB/TagA/CpsF family glycosyltransferase [Bradyrhizobium guangzhouense]|nr:WecB/TagA/CpsF family glycosyltransferase [Bradyrhizobium guangzhouense]